MRGVLLLRLTEAFDAEVWEIAVEVRSETASLLDREAKNGFDDYWIGPSRSLRMNSGSWFAYTPPVLDGVGFAMIAGDECSQILQLTAFLNNIMIFLGDRAALNRCPGWNARCLHE